MGNMQCVDDVRAFPHEVFVTFWSNHLCTVVCFSTTTNDNDDVQYATRRRTTSDARSARIVEMTWMTQAITLEMVRTCVRPICERDPQLHACVRRSSFAEGKIEKKEEAGGVSGKSRHGQPPPGNDPAAFLHADAASRQQLQSGQEEHSPASGPSAINAAPSKVLLHLQKPAAKAIDDEAAAATEAKRVREVWAKMCAEAMRANEACTACELTVLKNFAQRKVG